MKSTFIKGLIITVVGFLATTLTDLTTVNWAYVSIATLGFILLYLGKNWMFPSTSTFMGFNLQDVVSGAFVAVSMTLSSFAASVITVGWQEVDWKVLGLAVLSTTIGYVAKTFFSNSKGQVLVPEKK